ncbi:repeat set, removed, reverse transcriptase-domain containing protein, Ty1/Copia family of RNase HI [Histoplasma ohiense]|nr:repeat set, removed, reverse transcriptase-domain containing protein, Ty1/Copia family of RNase HI [Histoplasma ohiense (nom. inval.)]
MSIDNPYAAIQKREVEIGGKENFSFADVVNDFRSEYRKKGYSKPGLLVSNLATFNGRQAGQSRSRTCICGSKHSWVKCYYLNPSQRPEGWKENKQQCKKMDEALKNEDTKKKIDAAISKIAASNTEMIEQTLEGMVLKTSREPINHITNHSIDHPTDQSSITSDIIPVDRSTRCLNMNIKSSPSNQHPYLQDSWIFDTGAERHICNNRSRFLTYEPTEEQVYTGDSTTRVVGYETVWTYMTNTLSKQFKVILKNAAYIPFSHTNLITWKPCYHIGGIYLDGKSFRLRRISDDSIFTHIEVYDGLLVTEYHRTSENTLVLTNIAPTSNPAEPAKITEPAKISKSSTTPSYTAKSSTASSKIWHQHLGHPSMRAVEHLPTNAKGVQISDIKDIKNVDTEDKELCEPCHLAKAKNQISHRPHIRSKLPFKQLHADIVQGPSYCYNGEQWLIHFVCDYLRFHIAVTALRKSDIRNTFNKVLRWIKCQFDCETKIIQIDNERAVKESDIFKDWVTELGLEIEYSSEYIHEQNSAAEQADAIITTRARALRIESLLPQSLFPEIATTAVYLLNRISTKILGWKSPLQALEEYLHIDHHSCAHLHAYRCRAYTKIPNEILNRNQSQKLDPRAHIGYLVSYDSTNIFRIWIPHLDRVIRTRDVIFNENR